METCLHCGLPIPEDVYDVYCTRQCFNDAIDMAINFAKLKEDANKLLGNVEPCPCKMRSRLCELRNDAELRVANIDSYHNYKLNVTRTYFQSRADLLNDMLLMLSPSDKTCCCC